MEMTMAKRPQGVGRRTTNDLDDVDPADVLAAFDDSACRQILAAVDEEALTAQELSETCDIPLSTLYRKIDLLVETTLVDEQLRLDANGRHSREYVRSVVQVEITMNEGSIEMELSREPDENEFRRN